MGKALADIAVGAGRASAKSGRDVVDIVTFIEAPWGLGALDDNGQPLLKLFPVQRVILKLYYGIPLDTNPHGFDLSQPIPKDHPFYDPSIVDIEGYYKHRVYVSDFRRLKWEYYSEADYAQKMYDEGRCNIKDVTPGVERKELVLSLGRRSGKSLLSSCIAAYETYRLICKGDPHSYYGMAPSGTFRLVAIATDKDQAGLLYKDVSGHFANCPFFSKYAANQTMSYAAFQTPKDIERYGSVRENERAKASILVSFKSCIAKGLRGAANIVVIMDEMAHFTDEGQSSADAVYEAVVPSTATFSPKDSKTKRAIGPVESKVISISSPLGRQGTFFKLFHEGFRGGAIEQDRLCVQAPTWEVNPSVHGAFFEVEYLKDARSFFTEYGAQFSDRTRGRIESREDILACVNPNLRPRNRAAPRQPHFAGFDFGQVNDASAIAIGHIEGDEIVVDIVDSIKAGEGEFSHRDRLEFSDVADWIYDYSRRFYITEGMFDQYAGIPLEQALIQKGLRQFKATHFTQNLSSQIFQNFKDMLFDKRLQLYNWPIPEGQEDCEYITQLLEMQAEYKSKYITLVEAPKIAGKHDDLVDALVRMVWLASQHMGKQMLLMGNDRRVLLRGATDGSRNLIAARRKAHLTGSHPDRQIPRGRGGFNPFGFSR